MANDPFWFISFLLNAFIAFFTVTFLVQGALLLFRVKNPRTRALLRMLPIFYVGLDSFLSKLSIGNFFNPLSCESCIQKLFLYFMPELKSYLAENETALTKYLLTEFPNFPFTAILLIFSAVTLFLYLSKIPYMLLFSRWMKRTMRSATVSERPIHNGMLKELISKHRIKILLSETMHIPMAIRRKTIVMPKLLSDHLPQNEFEAILAHELEHLLWKDPTSKLFTTIISSLFWWVPMRWWVKRLHADQEIACDEVEERYGLEKEALATALVKVAKIHRQRKLEPIAACEFAGEPSSALIRLERLLDPKTLCQKKPFWCAMIGTAVGSIILLLCMM